MDNVLREAQTGQAKDTEMPAPTNGGVGQENVRVEGATWDINAPVEENTTFERLPTDIYIMEVADSYVEEDRMFGKPHPTTGLYPRKLVLVWETTEQLTDEQVDAGISEGERVWQRMNPTLRDNPNGGPSTFKAFVVSLQEQGLLPDQFKPEDFKGIRQRVSVAEYTNQNGKQSNKVTAVTALVRRRQGRGAVQQAPATGPTQRLGEQGRATRRLENTPVDTDGDGFLDTPDTEDGEIPF